MVRASALAMVVLPVPGLSSSSTCPPARKAARMLRIEADWPDITRPMFSEMAAIGARVPAASCMETSFTAIPFPWRPGAFGEERGAGASHHSAAPGAAAPTYSARARAGVELRPALEDGRGVVLIDMAGIELVGLPGLRPRGVPGLARAVGGL